MLKLINFLKLNSNKSNLIKFYSSKSTSSRFDQVHKESIENPEQFWGSKVDSINWIKKPKIILDKSNPPFEKWFVDGELNACFNCLDIHVQNGFGHQVAVIHDSPLTQTIKKITYKELLDEVKTFAGVLSKHGVNKGDRVLIYMPMIPQAIVAMLASVRLGAIHSLVFGGFASKELATRISHAKPKIIVSANMGVEPSRLINYKNLLDKAVEISDHKPYKCIFYNRKMFPAIDIKANKDLYLNYDEEISIAKPHDCVPVESNFPLYLLYTSGTTGTPKGVVRLTAGHLIALKYSMNAIYGVQPGETWFAGSDLGWTVGHSYSCYGPLLDRNTSVLYEGKPVGTPDASSYFRILSEHKVVSCFMAPTAVRAIHQQDPEGKHVTKFNLEKLKYIFLAGEKCDEHTMKWVKNVFKHSKVFDHYWQTETGYPITSMCAGIMSDKELSEFPIGVSGKPVPGYNIKVLREDKTEADADELGRIVIQLPMPPGTIGTLWKNDELFKNVYFKSYPGYYDTADVGSKSKDGFITVSARADDVINVAGHRLSSSSIEEAILEHVELSECAVVELNDEIKGVVPFGFLIKKSNSKTSEKELVKQVVANVRQSIGAVACFKNAVVINKLPKTRSGKISRATLKAMINNNQFKIPVTIEDASVYQDIKKALLNSGFENISEPS